MTTVSQLTASPPQTAAESPPSRRLTLARWRDPRLWVGLVLVAASVLVGARLLAAADNTVGVWAAERDLGAGTPLTRASLEIQQVRFTEAETAGSYLLSGQPLPVGAVLTRDLGAGELLARAAVGSADGAAAYELPVVVGAAGAPEDLRAGDVVDVWVAPAAGAGSDSGPAVQVLTAVPVVAASQDSGPLGEAATRQVLLGLDEAEAADLGRLLGETATGSVVLVRYGAGR